MVKMVVKLAEVTPEWGFPPLKEFKGINRLMAGTGRVMRDTLGGLRGGIRKVTGKEFKVLDTLQSTMTAHPVRTGAIGLTIGALAAGKLLKNLFGRDDN